MITGVLIIEGEPGLRDKLISAISGGYIEATGVANYFEALWELGEWRPDLVVLNEGLPLVDGWDACYYLHRYFGIPVIMMGAGYGEQVWLKVLEVGAEFYLSTPVSHLELTARIKTVLRRYKKYEVTHRN